MSELEQQIQAWRATFVGDGLERAELLDELESHLREGIERQIKLGLDERGAFEFSIQQIGRAEEIKSEFKKIEMGSVKRRIMIGAGIVSLLVGAAMVFPPTHGISAADLARFARGDGIYSALSRFEMRQLYIHTWGSALVIIGAGVTCLGLVKRKPVGNYV